MMHFSSLWHNTVMEIVIEGDKEHEQEIVGMYRSGLRSGPFLQFSEDGICGTGCDAHAAPHHKR